MLFDQATPARLIGRSRRLLELLDTDADEVVHRRRVGLPGPLQRDRQHPPDQFNKRVKWATVATERPIVMPRRTTSRMGPPDVGQAQRELALSPIRRTLG